jgi:hypothetical protein
MALTYLPGPQANAGVSAMFPTTATTHGASATNGTTTLTFTAADALAISVGMTVTGAGITSGGLVTTNPGTGVVTLSGTITALTASVYTFTLPVYGGLNTGSPSTTGANEAIADYTTRPSVTFGAPASGVELSTNAQTWTCATGFTATYFSYWTQATTGGTYLGGGTLTSLTIPSGALVTAAVGAISATLSG